MCRRFNTSQMSFLSLLSVIVLCLFCTSLCQFNTHQNITFTIPSISPFKLFLKPGDEVMASISNTNAKFFIAFLSENRSILITQEGHCFLPESCNLNFTSKWRVNGWLLMQIYYSHEYDYQIKVNSRVLKSQHIYSLLQAETFVYPYQLESQYYTISLYYQSKLAHQLIFIMFDMEYTIKANQTNTINISLTSVQPVFSFYFQLPDMDLQILTQLFKIQLIVTVPNSMLKNCNGHNHFNQRLKACGQLVETSSDTLIIDRYGIFSHFTIHRRETVTIRISLVQLVHFVEEFNPHLITSFLIHSADPRVFKDKPAKWILENYQTQYQQCKVIGTQCSFSFTIDPGRYSFLPFLPQRMPQAQFVYLFERLDDRGKLMQSYYSVFPAQYEDMLQSNSFLNFDGMMFEFTSTTEQLVQLQMRSDHELVMTAYNIHRKNQVEDDKPMFQLVQLGLQNSFSSNLNVITILTHLPLYQPHMLYIKFHSKDFFLQHMQLGTDKYNIYQTDPFLENTTIHLKLINGQFPHKKIKEKLLEDDDDYIEEEEVEDNVIDKGQVQKIEDSLSSSMMIILIVLVVVILVLTVLLGVLLMKHNRNKKAFNQLDPKTLLSDNNIIVTENINQKQHNPNPPIIYSEATIQKHLDQPNDPPNQNNYSIKAGNKLQHQVTIQMSSVNIISTNP